MDLTIGDCAANEFKGLQENLTAFSLVILADEENATFLLGPDYSIGRIVHSRIDCQNLVRRLREVVAKRLGERVTHRPDPIRSVVNGLLASVRCSELTLGQAARRRVGSTSPGMCDVGVAVKNAGSIETSLTAQRERRAYLNYCVVIPNTGVERAINAHRSRQKRKRAQAVPLTPPRARRMIRQHRRDGTRP